MPETPERQIEDKLVEKLVSLKYEYRPDVRDRASLEKNFREKFEALNRVRLTESEFPRLLEEIVTPDVFAAARTLRERNSFIRDDGTPLNYTLVNIRDWCKNTFEVVNQLRINTDNSHHRYDVILLINGVPAAQIELKSLGISPRRAMEQIVDYKNDPGNGYTKTLLCFVQLFIVSNRSDTWYFANNNSRHFCFNADERFLPVYQFAAEDNKKITHLDSFAETFLVKCTLGQMISRYMVLIASERKLMMMRPYQIYAVKAIVDCIHQNCGNGYVWHTTGSGKTLTSFKASTLLKDNPDIEKCLFVVDRKDLDRQTREEFNRFQEGCVEANTNTEALVSRLLSDDYADKVIVTASINDAIEYHSLFKTAQQEKQAADPAFQPLNIACVFSPPAEGNPDVKQIQEDLPQERADNEQEPEKKKEALKSIIADYNARYGSNHTINEFDLKGDEARSAFINRFKEVQRLKTQLDQYTDLSDEDKAAIGQILPEDSEQAFRGVYLETAQRLKARRGKGTDGAASPAQELDFEFVLFASAVIDYDYIMALIARFSSKTPGKLRMNRQQLVGLIQSDSKFIDEREEIAAYIDTLKAGEGLSEKDIREGYERFKTERHAQELAKIAAAHGLEPVALQAFVDGVLLRMVFDGERLSELYAPYDLGWKARTQAELALMEDCVPYLTKRAQGRDISGLNAYEQ